MEPLGCYLPYSFLGLGTYPAKHRSFASKLGGSSLRNPGDSSTMHNFQFNVSTAMKGAMDILHDLNPKFL
jgi:hypothetical protein